MTNGEMLRVGVDAMGGDFGPEVILPGVKKFMSQHPNVQVVIYGVSDEIERVLDKIGLSKNIEIINTEDNISADYKPNKNTCKDKLDSSIIKMSNDLASGNIDGMFSAGNTAAYIIAAAIIVKRDSRKARLALASEFPNSKKPISLGLDMGGNLSAKPEHNLDYAILAKAYLFERYGIDAPIKLISITTEKGKGFPDDEKSYELLEEAGKQEVIEFGGYIEPDGMLAGERKIVVGDARSMNLSLKGIKGGVNHVISKIPGLGFIKGLLNKSGGALLLGAKKPIGKANGNSDSKTISIALGELFDFMRLEKDTEIIKRITQNYEVLKTLQEEQKTED